MDAKVRIIDSLIRGRIPLKHTAKHGRNENIREVCADGGRIAKWAEIGRGEFTPSQTQGRIGLTALQAAIEDLLIGMAGRGGLPIPIAGTFGETVFLRIRHNICVNPVTNIRQHGREQLIVITLFDGVAFAKRPTVVRRIGMVLRDGAQLHLPGYDQNSRPPENAFEQPAHG